MQTSKTVTSVTLIVAGILGFAAAASAQNYPGKAVHVITGSPGGMLDIVARHLGQRLGERWGQPVVVENRGAAGMTVGSGMVAKSAPDGYTLLLADRTSHAVAPHLNKGLIYDPVKDFAPITLVASAPMVLVAHPSVPAADLREFIAYAKRNPGAVNYAGAGPGTAAHLGGELLKQVAGIDMVAVQYKGVGAAMIAILSGEVKTGCILLPVALPQIRAGKVKAYAITSSRRFEGAPDIPTAAEAGEPAFESEYWVGMFAPARTPAAIVGKLNREVVEILRTPEVKDILLKQGAQPTPGTPEEFAAFIESETTKMKKVIELARLHTD